MPTISATISACILARNEERRIEDALLSLQGWTDQIIVIDNESEDGTAGIARQYARCVLTAPRAANFDALRNLAIELATGSWLFYLDADERVPPQLGGMLRELVRREGEAFEAVCIPFKHFFCGKWMEHSGWWPGYKGPQLLKKGCFRYNERLHGGATVTGRTIFLSAENPDLAITHYSYDDLDHYLEKLNRYTRGEAENLLADGTSHSWQAQLAHFVKDWQLYYEQGRADLDGMHGFVLSFMSGLYRFASRAKLWDLRRQRGEGSGAEPVPASVREMLEFMAQVLQRGADPWIRPAAPSDVANRAEAERVPLLWRGPIFDTSGFADEGRHFVLALIEAGEPIAVAPDRWQDPDAGVSPAARALIDAQTVAGDTRAELCVSHTLLHFQQPNPNARFNIARVMFEADRLPDGIADRLDKMDRIWVPSEFNRETFANSGVAPEKIAVVPEAMDWLPYASPVLEPWPVPGQEGFRFLSILNWGLRKGWDVLIEAFALEFGGGASTGGPGAEESAPSVGLVIKWNSCGYTDDDVRQQIDAHLWGILGRSLSDFPNIHLWHETVAADELPRVYRAADAFVLPTRGEGWCRPLMEAMAAGLPTIVTAWSGVTEYHNATVGFPLQFEVQPVSPAAAREAPCYTGRCWAEPSVSDLRRLMRLVVRDRESARQKGVAAQKAVARQYSHAAVAEVVREELARCRSLLHAGGASGVGARPAARAFEWSRAPVFGRRDTVMRALGRLEELCTGAPCIVETGTLRDGTEGACAGDGWSTIAWGWYAAQKGGRAYTVDVSASALEVSRRMTAEYSGALIYVEANSLDFFREWRREERGSIDFLYLDSLDNLREQAASEAHHLAEAEAALPQLASRCLVLIDDTFPAGGQDASGAPLFWGKGARAIPFLLSRGFRLEWAEGKQVLLSRGGGGDGSGRVWMVDGALQGQSRAGGSVASAITEPSASTGRSPSDTTAARSPGGAVVPGIAGPAAVPAVPLLWRAPLFDASGFADEARQFVLGLIEAGEPIALAPDAWGPEVEQEPAVRARLGERIVAADTPAELCVRHTLLSAQGPSANARFNIARTMFETDRLPHGAADALNRMDRIWVPSEFNRETFVRSGVDPGKIAVVPGAIDATLFEAPAAEPWPLPGDEPYRFLSVFDWTLHKGWDVLVAAFAAEFGGDPHVGLILKIWSSQGYSLDEIRGQAESHLRETLGRSLAELPNVHCWQERLSVGDLPRVYRAVDAFVLPTRGEGWCRPLMEAMAAGLPTIATAWSGLTQFHNAAVGYPLQYEVRPVSEAGAREAPLYAGHGWAEPDVEVLRRLMRQLVTGPREARARGLAAKAAIAREYSRGAVTARLREELAHCWRLAARQGLEPPVCTGRTPLKRAADARGAATETAYLDGAASRPPANPVVRDPIPAVDFRAALGRPLRVRWEGDQSLLSSLARVNREFCLGLLASEDVELTLAEAHTSWHTLSEQDDPRFGALFGRRCAPLSSAADLTVRQYFPPDWRRPAEGKFIVIQPWEYGHLPCDWVVGAREQADEVWTHSRFVRDLYVRSGVPAEKVRIVPLGFDPATFRADGPAYPLATNRSLRFLFVGGALARKGADLLLAAYQRSFTAQDDVCLIVKDMGTRTFYQGMTYAEAFRRAQADTGGPDVLYLEDDLPDSELAALYRACTCVVLPYRAEGFALPPLEGMACGRPAIVTAGGPTDDYLDDSMALRVPRRRRMAGSNMLGSLACAGDPWQLEPDLDALIAALRWVRDHPEQTRERGERAREHVLAGWTWEHATQVARERLMVAAGPAHEGAVAPAKPWVPAGGAEGERSSKSKTESRTESKSKRKGKRKTESGAAALVSDGVCVPVGGSVQLSLFMIVGDEEARIRQCLESIGPYVDEMVVVDTGSIDRTREVARGCGARVFDFPWTDSFAEARNQSLAQARGAWVFWMDADDVISPECGKGLRELIRQCPERNAAYQVLVHIPPGPREFSASIVDHVKLFPNRPDLRFEHRIHEQILPAIRQAGLTIRFSDLYVTHQHYDRSEEGQAKKRRRDFRLLELDLRDKPDHQFILFNLGMTHLYATREYEVAAHYLVRCLERSHPTDSIVRKAYAMLTTARLLGGELGGAIEANELGRRHYPEDAELLFQAGQLYQEAGRFGEGRAALERLLTGQDAPHYRSVDAGLRTYRGRHELALLHRRSGDEQQCEQILAEVAAAHAEYVPARLDWVRSLHALGESEKARGVLEGIAASAAVVGELEELRRVLGVTRG